MKKNKHKKAKTGVDCDFPGHEEIKFGEVVEAPPKLVGLPKVSSLIFSVSLQIDDLPWTRNFNSSYITAIIEGIQECPRCFAREDSVAGY